MAGLHDMRPIASRSMVIMATPAPPRAQTRAASAPAWPPPITITSKRVMFHVEQTGKRLYFPMQNLVNISVNTSSRVIAPVRRASALDAR